MVVTLGIWVLVYEPMYTDQGLNIISVQAMDSNLDLNWKEVQILDPCSSPVGIISIDFSRNLS